MNDQFTIGPPAMTYQQYRRICQLLETAGYWNRGRRLRHLSTLIGRHVTDWGQLSARDADRAIHALEKEDRGDRPA